MPFANPRSVALRASVQLALLLGLISWWAVPAQAAEVNVLSSPSVTPVSGTTTTPFTFSVHFASTAGRAAEGVSVEVGGQSVALVLVSGTAADGTFSASTLLPAGTWPVIFSATTLTGPDPAPVAGPDVTVTLAPTPTPAPSTPPRATPRATPPITPAPKPTPIVTRRPSGSPAPTAVPAATVAASPTASTAPASSTQSEEPAITPEPSAAPIDPESPASWRGLLLALGGGLTVTGAAVLGIQYARVRAQRRGVS